MAKYNVFESTNMASTHYAKRILDAVCAEDIENGTFGYLTGTGDIQTFVKGYKAGEEIVVVDNPAWDEVMVNGVKRSDVRRDKYVNKAGVPFRVRVIAKGDTFATAIEGIEDTTPTSTVAKAKTYSKVEGVDTENIVYLTINATTGKLVPSTSATSNAKFEAIIDKVRLHGGTIVTTAHTYGYSTKMYECTVKVLA